MALYGAFSTSMLGMMSQARSLQNIGSNIANVNTGGYRRTDTGFSTVLSQTIGSNKYISDIGGVRPKDISTVDQQGVIVSSELSTDVAISGKGFFVMNTAQDGSGDTVYGRDGSFEVKTVNDVSITGIGGESVTVKDGYLADKNGHFIQGWAYQNGAVTTSGTTESLRVDQYAFIDQFQATTQGELALNLPAGDDLNHANPYDITVYDSVGNRKSVRLDFTKTGTNTWTVTPTTQLTPIAQVDTVSLGGSVGEAGDTYSVTVNGNAVTYSTTGAEASIDVIRDNLISLINTDGQLSATVTAAAGASGQITLTAKNAGNALTTSVSANQGPASAAQVDTISLGGTFQAGDTYTVTIDGTPVSYTAIAGDLDLNGVRDKLVAQINASGIGSMTAAPGGAGQLVLTASAAGTAYTLATATTDVGGGTANPDQTMTFVNTTPNYTAVADNTATFTTTTANGPTTTTGAATTMTFNSDGTLASPTTLNLALTYTGSTASIALDMSKITQFYGDFLPTSYTKDGFASSNMRSITFDGDGDVYGVFEDNTQRKIYKLALGVFSNPNGLDAINGNVYRPTEDSGSATITTAGDTGYASLTPNARELSNVDMADEFSKMMMTQTAYNASSTVFRTADEMTTVARDLKR